MCKFNKNFLMLCNFSTTLFYKKNTRQQTEYIFSLSVII